MTVQRIDRDEIVSRSLEVLGLDDSTDLFSLEGVCASLRRAAAFLCPASPRQILDTVHDVLTPLSSALVRDALADALDLLVACGDLLELRAPDSRSRLLYLGPPSFVEKHRGEYLVIGVRPSNLPLVDEASNLEIIYAAHTRSVVTDVDLGDTPLMAAGLHRMSREQWTRAPRSESSADVLENARELLARTKMAPGAIAGLTIIDTAQSPRFYRGRWRGPSDGDNGLVIGRRPQTYGAPIWCLIEIEGGVPQTVIDLPIDSHVAPGWDDALRIQAAIDSEFGTPQIFRVRQDPEMSTATFDFFSPVPSWAERYFALSGKPADKGPKSLFAYCLPSAAAEEARQFLSTALWMAEVKEDR